MLAQLWGLFLKLGFIGYGGPAAHLSLIESEVVRKRQWISKETFLELSSVSLMIPGPISTQLVMLIGYQKLGFLGLFVSGIAFVLPSVLIVFAVAVLYRQFGVMSWAEHFFAGMRPVIAAILITTAVRFFNTGVKGCSGVLLFLSFCLLSYLGVPDYWCLLAGLVAPFLWRMQTSTKAAALVSLDFIPLFLEKIQQSWGRIAFSISSEHATSLFWYFTKTGAQLFGGGYVLFSYLESDLVMGLISRQELADAIAVGQMTPGPTITAATFIGTLTGGWLGAVVSTVGIFLPGLIVATAIAPFLKRVQASEFWKLCVSGITVVTVAFLARAAYRMAMDPGTGAWYLTAICCFLLQFVTPVRLLLVGALYGLIAFI